MYWTDDRLAWDPEEYGETTCTIKIATFPFDNQVCEMSFMTWVYELLALSIIHPEGIRTVCVKSSGHVTWPAQYYAENNCRVKVGTFPFDTQLGIGLTSLVSMTVLLDMLSDAIPKTVDFPILGIYVVLCVGVTSFACVIVVVFPLDNFHRKTNLEIKKSVEADKKLGLCYYEQLHLSGFVSMKLVHVLFLSSMVLGAVSYTTLDPFNSTGSGPPAFPKPVPPTTSEEPKIEAITTVATTTALHPLRPPPWPPYLALHPQLRPLPPLHQLFPRAMLRL
ncbi:unnamed protein product, partial [Mesorhabditis spiculigera]